MEGDHPHSATYCHEKISQTNEIQTTESSLYQIENMIPKEKYQPYVLSLA